MPDIAIAACDVMQATACRAFRLAGNGLPPEVDALPNQMLAARCQQDCEFILVKLGLIARRRAPHEPPSVFLFDERHVLERARGVRPGKREISECAVVEGADFNL